MMRHSKGLFVMGMHRSGTSALAGILNTLGVNFGNHLIEAGSDNPKGYYEPIAVSHLHKELFDSLGVSWDSIAPLPEGWTKSDAAFIAKAKIIDFLKDNFSGVNVWAVKDPRICRLLPLWLSVLDQLECSPCFLITVRHPNEVSASTQFRNGFGDEKGALLWLRHVLEMETDTGSYPRAVITYESLLSDWRETLKQASATLGIELDLKTNQDAADAFLDAGLRNHKANSEGPPPSRLKELSISAYKALAECNGQRPDKASAQLSEISAELSAADACYAALLKQMDGLIAQKDNELEKVKQELKSVTGQVDSLRASLNDTEQLIDSVYRSRSWKLTRILREASSLSPSRIKSK